MTPSSFLFLPSNGTKSEARASHANIIAEECAYANQTDYLSQPVNTLIVALIVGKKRPSKKFDTVHTTTTRGTAAEKRKALGYA